MWSTRESKNVFTPCYPSGITCGVSACLKINKTVTHWWLWYDCQVYALTILRLILMKFNIWTGCHYFETAWHGYVRRHGPFLERGAVTGSHSSRGPSAPKHRSSASVLRHHVRCVLADLQCRNDAGKSPGATKTRCGVWFENNWQCQNKFLLYVAFDLI